MRGVPTNLFVSLGLLDSLEKELLDEDSDVRRMSSWPVEKTFVYLDVSDYSKYPPGQQLLVVSEIQRMWPNATPAGGEPNRQQLGRYVDSAICIGDGFIFVLKRVPDAVLFAARLANMIEEHNASRDRSVEIHFRCGIHVGPVFGFWESDLLSIDRWNYIGDGINGGSRVLTAIGKDYDDMVYLSGDVRERLVGTGARNAELLRALHNRGRHRDKHGKLWRVYELNHTELQ